VSGRITVLSAGPLCSIQDAGRHGYLRYGITPAGPMDWIAHATADALAGNPVGTAAIEVGPGGVTLRAQGGAVRLGISATGFNVLRDGSRLPTRVALTLPEGVDLAVSPGRSGLWAYVALSGGPDLEPVMGSLSTHLRSGLGPFGGRALQAGDAIGAAFPADGAAPDVCVNGGPASGDGPIRVTLGPQDDRFAPEVLETFLSADYTVAPRSDRMAYRLSGPPLEAKGGHDIVSDGIALGAVQVPGDGQPFVLMADRQPTGGYPKIATVIRADLPRLAQTRPGQRLRFQAVSVAVAVAELAKAREGIVQTASRTRTITYVAPGGPTA
jgi:biotin-dependent carboxylase-like uncharacterized protein